MCLYRSEFSVHTCGRRRTDLFFSDYCTHELLSHLTPEGSPTFLVTRRPQNILDLGCGRGLWVAETAVTWKHARITAFDVVDLSRLVREWLPPSVASRITWMKGNLCVVKICRS